MSEEFHYPLGVRVSLKIKLNETEQGKNNILASDQFLDAMRPILFQEKSQIDSGAYVPPRKRYDRLGECETQFRTLLNFLSLQLEHVRREINTGIYDLGLMNLEEIKQLSASDGELSQEELKDLEIRKIQADSEPYNLEGLENFLSQAIFACQCRMELIDKSVEGKLGKTFKRLMFLSEMVITYHNAYGVMPRVTYNRREDPEYAKTKGFYGVAAKMCQLVGHPKGIEKQLVAIVGKKSPRDIEEVRAELKAVQDSHLP